MDTPIALLVFNHPETTAMVFDAVRTGRPPRLLILADGLRADRPGAAELCAATRRIMEAVDRPCKAQRNYASENIGCGDQVSSGINWIFEQVDRVIIFEDDCVPRTTFFEFCSQDDRMMMNSGNNFLQVFAQGHESHYFSRYPHIWGRATWRRAWRTFEFSMKRWAALSKTDWLQDFFWDCWLVAYWRACLESVTRGDIDNWDYQWLSTCWSNQGLSAVPNANLVTNKGFEPDATQHTKNRGTHESMALQSMSFPLEHPAEVTANREADEFEERKHFLPTFARARLILKELAKKTKHRLVPV